VDSSSVAGNSATVLSLRDRKGGGGKSLIYEQRLSMIIVVCLPGFALGLADADT
jgi:hypothetical protein